MKNIYRNLLGCMILIFCINLTIANGLQIIQTDIQMNKTYWENFDVQLNISNQENFKFYNITFEEDFVSMPNFDLESGETKLIQITITKNEDYSGVLTLRGEYLTQIGSSNKTEIVTINYQTGFDKCHLDLIKGDKIIWANNILDEISLVNTDNENIDFATILEDSNYSKTFNYPEEFDYYATRIGIRFTEICRINIMDDSGLVHRSEYDDTINLNLKILYDPTIIETRFLKTSYTIDFNKQKEDIFTIENTGNEKARNIYLSGEWFQFTKNDFDLDIGDSINIGYTIKPEIFETNNTNKTYDKFIEITGNFQTINQKIEIFILYSKIDDLFSDGIADEELIENFFKYWCQKNPDNDICKKTIINESSSDKTYSLPEDALKKIIERQISKEDEQRTYQKNQLETDINQTNQISSMNLGINESKNEVSLLREDIKNLGIAIVFTIIFILFISGGFLLYNLIFNQGFKDIMKNKLKFHKAERTW